MTKVPFPAMKLPEWPESDQRFWAAAKRTGDFLDEDGPAAYWSKAYIDNLEGFFGQFLSFLALSGALDLDAAPLQRVTRETIKAFINAFAPGRSDGTLVTVLHSIATFVWACHQPEGVPWLTLLARKYERRAKPARPLHSRTASIDELEWLGETLLQEGSDALARGDVDGARLYRDGLIVLVLVVHPVRRGNLASLQLGKTLLVEGDRFRAHFGTVDTKNGVELNRLYPDWLSSYIQSYLDNIRPILMEKFSGPDEGWLWIGRHGTVMRAQSLRVITTNHSKVRLGRAVPPHNFRHSVVTDIARLDPEHVGIAKDLLGHKTYSTTEEAYILASSFSATARYQAIVEKLRRK